MRPAIFSFPTQTVNGVCATQTTTTTDQPLALNGSLSNFNAGVTPFEAIVAPGIQRAITLTSTGNISTSTFTITGIDTSGYAVSTTLTGPNNGTATTVAEFFKVTAISVGTIATSAFTVGVGITGTSRWAVVDTFQNPVAVSVAITMNTATTSLVTVQRTFDPISTTTTPVAVTAVGLSEIGTSTSLTYSDNATAYRAIWLASTTATGTMNVNFNQSGY
jgi:hypothetical protein